MKRVTYSAVTLLLIGLYGCQPSDPNRSATGPQTGPDDQTQQQDADSVAQSTKALKPSNNPPSLTSPQQGPALPDFGAIKDVKQKKQQFFAYLEPMIAQENAHVLQLRQHFEQLLTLLEQQPQLHPDDQQWLARVNKAFRIDADSEADQLRQLLAKVDEIPASLVKAQAANESAWGTSRFARQANNLFGQWCFKPGCGIAPLQRAADQTHEVEAFNSVAAGLRSYFTNINGNNSYSDLRQIRRCLRRQQQPLTGRALAAGLTHYSARGGHYVDELQSMIRINKLEPWSIQWWGENQPNHPCYSLVQIESDKPDPIRLANADSSVSATVSMAVQSAASNAAISNNELNKKEPLTPVADTSNLKVDLSSTDSVQTEPVAPDAQATTTTDTLIKPIESAAKSE